VLSEKGETEGSVERPGALPGKDVFPLTTPSWRDSGRVSEYSRIHDRKLK